MSGGEREHQFQANYDQRSIQNLRETIEYQQEEPHRAQAERRRRDHQLHHDQLLQKNWQFRGAHVKSLNEMEELKKFESSTIDTTARWRLLEDQDTILELTGKIQEWTMKLIVWMISKILRMLNQFAVELPLSPVNQCLSHFIQFLKEC